MYLREIIEDSKAEQQSKKLRRKSAPKEQESKKEKESTMGDPETAAAEATAQEAEEVASVDRAGGHAAPPEEEKPAAAEAENPEMEEFELAFAENLQAIDAKLLKATNRALEAKHEVLQEYQEHQKAVHAQEIHALQEKERKTKTKLKKQLADTREAEIVSLQFMKKTLEEQLEFINFRLEELGANTTETSAEGASISDLGEATEEKTANTTPEKKKKKKKKDQEQPPAPDQSETHDV